MSRKVLCPACGTKNQPGFSLTARCTACAKRLPTPMPRGLVYAARTLARPLMVIMVIGAMFWLAPQFQAYRKSLTLLPNASASTDKNLPASHKPD